MRKQDVKIGQEVIIKQQPKSVWIVADLPDEFNETHVKRKDYPSHPGRFIPTGALRLLGYRIRMWDGQKWEYVINVNDDHITTSRDRSVAAIFNDEEADRLLPTVKKHLLYKTKPVKIREDEVFDSKN